MGGRVVFVDPELKSVPIEGPAAGSVSLSPPPVSGGRVVSARVSADGRIVVYRADLTKDDVFHLCSVPLAGPVSAGGRVSTTPIFPGPGGYDTGSGQAYSISSNGSTVVYLGGPGTMALFVAPIPSVFSDGFESGDTGNW